MIACKWPFGPYYSRGHRAIDKRRLRKAISFRINGRLYEMPNMKHASSCLIVLTFFLLFSGASHGKGCDEKSDPCGKPTEWNEFETVRLRMTQEGMATPVRWFMQTSRANHDLQVEIDFPDPKKPQRGTLMMVEGTILVSKGIGFSPGREIDSLDSPMLFIILTGKVLSRALPEGPGGLKGNRPIRHEDKKTGIQFATPSAQGFIPPPWSVAGTVIANSDGSRDFDLVLKWIGEGATKKPTSMSLAGQLKHKSDFQIDSNMALEGWSVFGVGPIIEKTKSGTIYDYGAKPYKSVPKTIADIRKAIAIENSPGEPDLSLNLAGFWKESCTDTFGLRIKPVDKPGMYTVTFCGPGGCGDEQNERKTFIKGDKRYNIVSATVLQVGAQENRSTYMKCSDKMLP